MILYKALKYIILDHCLETLFKGMHKSINNKRSINIEDLSRGMYLSSMRLDIIVWKGCTILDSKYEPLANWYVVSFKYLDTNSSILDKLGEKKTVDLILDYTDDVSMYL